MVTEHDTLTTHDGSAEGANPEDPLGIWWVHPEYRFTPFVPGATVGRTSDNAVRIDGGSVSRVHCRLRREGAVWVLSDAGSKNGTFVNGQQTDTAPLAPQDVVRVGKWVGIVCSCREPFPSNPVSEVSPGWLFREREPGRLPSMLALAQTSLALVLRGETGTGKEVAARGIHALSGRRGPFIAVNCAAIPESLAEAQLFGHRKGAFTGAHEASEGFIAAAHDGTLFLDEVADLSLPVQAKLLRALEEKAVTAIGSTRSQNVNFRILCATQVPLSKLVAHKLFRADLCARVSGQELELLPLRQRREEVVPLFRFALRAEGAGSKLLSHRFVERLLCFDFPFNVRELVQLARLVAASGGNTLEAGDLPERFSEATALASETPPPLSAPRLTRRQAWLLRHADELATLKEAMQTNGGNVSQSAKAVSMPRHRAIRLLAADAEFRGESNE